MENEIKNDPVNTEAPEVAAESKSEVAAESKPEVAAESKPEESKPEEAKPETGSETVVLPRTDSPDLITPPTSEAPAISKFGTLNPAHKFFWRGNDINGNEYVGSGDNASQCNVDAGLIGSATCHLRLNPDYIEPEVKPVVVDAPATPSELNRFFKAGFDEGHRYFEDLKALILAWASEQHLSSGGVADVDTLPFVIYARHNP